MTLTDAVTLAREATVDNGQFVATRAVFTALELVLEAANNWSMTEGMQPDDD